MIRVSAHQTNFLPWPGFWHKLISADVFVACAGFKYTKRGYENRVLMRDGAGWATIPVTAGVVPSKEVRIADPEAPAYLARRIAHWSRQRAYRYRHRLDPIIERLRHNGETYLYRLNYDLIALVLDVLGHSKTKLVLDTNVRTGMTVEDAISDIVTAHGNVYLTGSSGPRYVDLGALHGIERACVQRLRHDAPSETVLHLLAEIEDPLSALSTMGTWESWV